MWPRAIHSCNLCEQLLDDEITKLSRKNCFSHSKACENLNNADLGNLKMPHQIFVEPVTKIWSKYFFLYLTQWHVKIIYQPC